MQKSFIGAMFGMAIFGVAAAAYQYMIVRVWREDSTRYGRDVMDRYEFLVKQQQAPRWPIYAVWLGGSLGIGVAFGSIIFL